MASAFAVLAALSVCAAWITPAHAQQQNFEPLQRGTQDFTEVEQRILIARGLEVSADYAFESVVNNQEDLPREQKGTRYGHDLRLHLNTIFNDSAQVHLTLALGEERFSGTELREASNGSTELQEGISTNLFVREAYLRYDLNVGSYIFLGQHELSLGDRRGKVFNALVPGATFDCRAGTWCVPMGIARIGAGGADAVTHFAMEYTAWDTQNTLGQREFLEVEVFRIGYNEQNIPLGVNLGPARFNADDPITGTSADSSQWVDGVDPVYYDADSFDYYGFRVAFASTSWFVNFDATGFRGERKYHAYRRPESGILNPLTTTGAIIQSRTVRGAAVESEFGWRNPNWRIGARLLSATGDPYLSGAGGQDFQRNLKGYYEITPGSYAGTRLYFNGTDGGVPAWYSGKDMGVTLGSGLGHSINNTQMNGLFLDYVDRESAGVGYSLGIYQLSLNEPIPDSRGDLQESIGVEIDNLLIWFVRPEVRIEFEANMILAGGAFRIDDHSIPNSRQDDISQFVARFVYQF